MSLPDFEFNIQARKAAVEKIVGEVEWDDDHKGHCECPGIALHTTKDGPCDCTVYLDGVPTISCFHASCQQVVREHTAALRRAILGGCRTDSATCDAVDARRRKQRNQEITARERLRQRVVSARPRLLRDYAWPYAQILTDSPVTLPADPAEHWRGLLGHFRDEDVVWIGDLYDSGKPEHAAHFRRKIEWLEGNVAPGPFICPAVFNAGSHSRGIPNVAATPLLVVESDVLDKNQVGAVFRWLKTKVGLQLVAIVDTAGKSLHAWFVRPPDEQLAELTVALPALGCDRKMFTKSQPARLPGARRGEGFQRLIYLEAAL